MLSLTCQYSTFCPLTENAQNLETIVVGITINFRLLFQTTVKPRFNEPLYNEVLGITNDFLQPGQSYSKMCGKEPRYNEPRYSEILDITNTIEDPKRKIYPDITSKCHNATKDDCETDQRPMKPVLLTTQKSSAQQSLPSTVVLLKVSRVHTRLSLESPVKTRTALCASKPATLI